jgi:hypothetical protein
VSDIKDKVAKQHRAFVLNEVEKLTRQAVEPVMINK